MKTEQDTGLISIEDVLEIAYAESNGHVADDVTFTYLFLKLSVVIVNA